MDCRLAVVFVALRWVQVVLGNRVLGFTTGGVGSSGGVYFFVGEVSLVVMVQCLGDCGLGGCTLNL